MKDDELYLFKPSLPVNSLLYIRRLEEILRENKTNSIMCLKGEAMERAKACLMILMMHAYDQLFKIDSVDEYSRLKKALAPALVAQKLQETKK